MRKKQFKTESKKMLDMMINSIYTNKEIFIRELISNSSDAIDKRYFNSLTNTAAGLDKDEYSIFVSFDKDNRTITIKDNGCGMTKEELENNLGTIAKSGSLDFKTENKTDDIDIIGQFGVGFYSAFMVADKITIRTKSINSDQGYIWESEGADGYTVEECDYDEFGSEIVLTIKEDTENENYTEFLQEYKIKSLIKKYSDYIRYPIKMDVSTSQPKPKENEEDAIEYETVVETQTINSMVPLWKKSSSEISEDEYNQYYSEKFYDFEAPAKVIHTKFEGTTECDALLYIPKKAPYDYYSKTFEKGLQLYSRGVLIMERCADLLPDYFSFVRGLADSSDLSLNISREMLQQDHQLKVIAKAIDKKLKSEFAKMLKTSREDYENLFAEFGRQLKFGCYSDFGANKSALQDLLLFKSSFEKKYTTFKEYLSRMKEDQKDIYFASGETIDKIELLPQAQAVLAKGFEVLYLYEDIDEFVIRMLMTYDDKKFVNVCDEELDISSEVEKTEMKLENENSKDILEFLKQSVSQVHAVRFTNTLDKHPVCLSTEGGVSTEMEKVLSAQPGNEGAPKAQTVLEINMKHPIAEKLKSLYETDKEKAEVYAKVLYSQARLISGLSIENPTELSNLVCSLMVD